MQELVTVSENGSWGSDGGEVHVGVRNMGFEREGQGQRVDDGEVIMRMNGERTANRYTSVF
jgi:hypothetical protein